MLKKYKIKNIYITRAICDKCGGELIPIDICLTIYPAQYSYKCENPDCDGYAIFQEDELPGKLEYEFEEEKDTYFNKLQNQAVAQVKNKKDITYLKRKLTIPVKICPYCQTQLEGEAMKTPYGGTHLIYECPNNCKLTFSESDIFLPKDDESVIKYEEEDIKCTTLLP